MAELSKVHKRIEKMVARILSVLAWLFVASCIGLMVLGGTGLDKRWHLDLKHLGFIVAMWVGVPLFVFWGGANGILILWRQWVAWRTHQGKVDGRVMVIFVMFGILAVGLISDAAYCLIRILSR
jgi:hypothetical protein